jgi:hypothetical protein
MIEICSLHASKCALDIDILRFLGLRLGVLLLDLFEGRVDVLDLFGRRSILR